MLLSFCRCNILCNVNEGDDDDGYDDDGDDDDDDDDDDDEEEEEEEEEDVLGKDGGRFIWKIPMILKYNSTWYLEMTLMTVIMMMTMTMTM